MFSDDLVKSMSAVEGEDSWYTACGEAESLDATLVFCFGKAVARDLGIIITILTRSLQFEKKILSAWLPRGTLPGSEQPVDPSDQRPGARA